MRKLIILLLLITPLTAFSQEREMISPYLTFQYFKNSGDSSYLKTTLTYSRNRIEVPVPGLKINCYLGDTSGNILQELVTDSKGIAVCNLLTEDLRADKDGFWQFTASFEGNDTIEAVTSELMIRDASVFMECTEADSVKTVSVRVEKFENGKMVPAAGEYLTVYVPRMFSLLPIGETTLDDDGFASLEFPSDIPGDIEGNLAIIAKFDEHPEFGTIERKAILKWGIPFIVTDHSSHRALWTKTAPKWMIYTLTILLTGVWGHYLFAFISLIRIKRNAKKANFMAEKEQGKEIFIK